MMYNAENNMFNILVILRFIHMSKTATMALRSLFYKFYFQLSNRRNASKIGALQS